MSAVITPVSLINGIDLPVGGSIIDLVPGSRVAATDPSATSSAVTLVHDYLENGLGSISGSSYGVPKIAIGTEGAQLQIAGN